MATEKINLLKTPDEFSIGRKKASETQQEVGNYLVSKAQSLGINIEEYYIYDENNECIGIDTAKLNTAVQEAMKTEQAKKENNQYQDDSFERTETTSAYTIEETDSKAKSSKNTIDEEYRNAAVKYAQSINLNAESISEEGKLVKQWEEIESDANKLTSATASNTTVLEGVKEFITTLTGLINDTKNYKAKEDEKESNISLETERDIQDKNNDIEVYGTNFFTDNPFKSALETFDIEEDDVAV